MKIVVNYYWGVFRWEITLEIICFIDFKDQATKEVKRVLKEYKPDIEASFRNILIHLLVVQNRGDLYNFVNEFMDGKLNDQ